ncbi:hypothetical protein GGX14DRAFT_697455 [Mycena pura]|uniref:DUF6533 domain-containing protein n=1 Tax=Mycena pura TaxID=153505 RepID=A0AAD6YHV0_9AGAR|nr:hypothetical protein GGX14DRAFT_697455 [Mycena pura]
MSDQESTKFLHTVAAVQVYNACTTSVLVWDWLSCLPQEWRCIWKSGRWSSIKFLYIMVRYYTLLLLTVTDIWFFANWQESTCARYIRVIPGLAVIIELSVESVLAVRIFALYGRKRKIAIFLFVMLATFLGVMIAVPILAFDYTRLPTWPAPCIFTGKPSIAGPKFIIAFYASPMTCDAIMTAMTVYRAIKQNQSGPSSSLMNRMVRDGLFYFFAITSLNLVNVIFFIQSDELIQAVNAPMSIQMSSVLCCRLILNLRAEGEHRRSVTMFGNARAAGRFVADGIHENLVVEEMEFSPNPPSLGFLPSAPPNSTQSTVTRDGIIIHFERGVRRTSDGDSWIIGEEGEKELEGDGATSNNSPV